MQRKKFFNHLQSYNSCLTPTELRSSSIFASVTLPLGSKHGGTCPFYGARQLRGGRWRFSFAKKGIMVEMSPERRVGIQRMKAVRKVRTGRGRDMSVREGFDRTTGWAWEDDSWERNKAEGED